MTESEADIQKLIPQRAPMIQVDRLIQCDHASATSEMMVREDNLFVCDGCYSAAGMLENMAQTAAARTGWLMRQGHPGENKIPPIGVIGSISDAVIHFRPKVGQTLQTSLLLEHEVLMATIVKGVIRVNGLPAAEARLKIFLTEEHPLQP